MLHTVAMLPGLIQFSSFIFITTVHIPILVARLAAAWPVELLHFHLFCAVLVIVAQAGVKSRLAPCLGYWATIRRAHTGHIRAVLTGNQELDRRNYSVLTAWYTHRVPTLSIIHSRLEMETNFLERILLTLLVSCQPPEPVTLMSVTIIFLSPHHTSYCPYLLYQVFSRTYSSHNIPAHVHAHHVAWPPASSQLRPRQASYQ